MKRKLKVKVFDVDFAKKEVVLHDEDAQDLGVRAGSRVSVSANKKSVGAVVNTTCKFIREGQVGVFDEVQNSLGLKSGDVVGVERMDRPVGVYNIKKKLEGKTLEDSEIGTIVEEMVSGTLSDVEISAFVCALQAGGMDMHEVEVLTKKMAASGDELDFGCKTYDKHSIGGVPGNKVSLLVVPTVAAAGLVIPKTASRAITSPAGTADTMEVFAPVELGIEKIKKVVGKTGACLVWGGAVDLAPADDLMINVEYPLDLDPRPLLLASIMSKKKSVNADFVVMDIPVGKGTKVKGVKEGEELACDLIGLGKRLGIKVECAITYGAQPVGHAIGPVLEAREALRLMKEGEGPDSLVEKSCGISAILLEAGGVAKPKKGLEMAKELLLGGETYKKFKQIVRAQGGDPNVKLKDLRVGKHRHVVRSRRSGFVSGVDNHVFKLIARGAGAPRDAGAGVVLEKKRGYRVEKNDVLFTIYAENKDKLEHATAIAEKMEPTRVETMVLERVKSHIHSHVK